MRDGTEIVGSKYLTARQVADRFGVSIMALNRWLADPELAFPRPIKIAGRRYFHGDKIAAWEAQQAAQDKPPRGISEQILSGVIDDYDGLVEALRKRREQLGLTNLDLELRSGLQLGYVSKLENHKTTGCYTRAAGPVVLPLWLQGLNCGLVLVDAGKAKEGGGDGLKKCA